ncbi:tripartite tricarboxylate transporter substrate-binding protein [Xylophilus sp. ASV27]|uniref:tripartite tricarboxylate transporter substrate-binding protein n=1 Tax=Xylophilus sp. ASV27 TaxID=2795129 RepID=UPI00351BF459
MAPADVVRRLNQAVNAALQEPALRAMIEGSGGEIVGGTPEACGQFLAQERARWAPVIRNASITLD